MTGDIMFEVQNTPDWNFLAPVTHAPLASITLQKKKIWVINERIVLWFS